MRRSTSWSTVGQSQGEPTPTYTEHTFAYRGHEVVWKDAGPSRAKRSCCSTPIAERHIELVPNQNSFGHMHRWLKHDAYRHWPAGRIDTLPNKEPYSLCFIDPGSLDLLADLHDQLLPHQQPPVQRRPG